MPRIFAIDWDRNEARALLVQSGPTGTSVTGTWSAPLEPAEGAVLNGKQVGARLAEVMAGFAVGKATTIIGVGRDHVQIKQLSLPPAPPEELPELVRFQAEREFTALGSEAALDYIPISGDNETAHQVLAVALSAAGINEAREVAQAASVEPDRITVRALATVALVQRAGASDNNAVSLIANPLGDEADLTVLESGKVVLMRTVRLPDADQAAARQRTLIGEIRRTIAAARQQSSDRPVDQVLLCGNASAVDQIAGLGEELGIPVKLFDPATNAPSGFAGSKVAPASLARFSAVLGMALSEVDRRPPIVDFLNVRRKVEKQRFGPQHIMAAAAAAVVLLAIVFFFWSKNHALAGELATRRAELKDKTAKHEKLKKDTEEADATESWLATNPNWLDELNALSHNLRSMTLPKDYNDPSNKNFPVDTDVVIKSLTLMPPAERNAEGGQIQAQAVAQGAEAQAALDLRLRDDDRLTVLNRGGQEDASKSVKDYPWAFNLMIGVPAPEDEPKKVETPPADTTKTTAESEAAKSEAAKTPTDQKQDAKEETKAAKETPKVEGPPKAKETPKAADDKAADGQAADAEKKEAVR